MLRRLGVRGKILATLAVPVLVLILGAGFLVVGSYDTWQYSKLQKSYLGAVVVQDDLIAALQQERWNSVAVATGRTSYSAGLADTRKATDEAAVRLDRVLGSMDRTSSNRAVMETMAKAIKARTPETLALARSLVDERVNWGTSGGGTAVRNLMSYYDTMIDAQLALGDILSTTVEDRGLGIYVIAYSNTNRLVDAMQVEAQSGQILIEDSFAETDTELDRRSVAVQMAEGASVRTAAVRTISDLGVEGLAIPDLSLSFTTARDGLLQAAPATIPLQYRTQWEDNARSEYGRLLAVRDDVRTRAIAVGDAAEAAATRELLITLALAVAAVVASIFVALTVARTITEPLRRLTDAAGRVRDELPRIVDEVAEPGKSPDVTVEKIEVTSQDEVGRLATAFNEVNSVTLRVAREQASLRGSIAEMFINVARRDQVLLNRQLIFLDELERSEEDPGTLSNLFRLDHLATRMRRNAESLLVLAGIESGRRVRAAMPLSDVVRTAASEIELYERVELDLHVDPLMLGHNALPAAHLIAELLENATVFSDPGTPVVVSVDEDPRWITVSVLDEGLGMSDEELDEANEKASTYAASEIVGSQRLGLYVVGRLAYKLGASVRYSRPEARVGTLVRVMLPRALFIAPEEIPLDAPVDPLGKDTRDATDAWVAPEPSASAPLASRRPVEPEAPVAVPVDLDALTDGSTSTGMPRRKTRTSADAEAPSVALGALDERDIVLPELAASELPSDFTSGASELWSPPSAHIAPSTLPSRGSGLPARGGPKALEPLADISSGAVAPVPERAAVFSNFRTRRSLEFMGESLDDASTPNETVAPEPAAMVVPDLVADDPQELAIPGLEPDASVLGVQQGAVVEPLPATWTPSFAEDFGSLEASRGGAENEVAYSEPTFDDPAALAGLAAGGYLPETAGIVPADDSFAPVADEVPWQPVGNHGATPADLPEASEADERLRVLGAHVGSIASAADVDDEAYPDMPTRRGRYARYEEPEVAAAPEEPAYVAAAPEEPVYVDPVPAEADPSFGFAIPGLAEDEGVGHVSPVPAADFVPMEEDAPWVTEPEPVAPTVAEPVALTFPPLPSASAEIAPFAVTAEGQPLPSFSDVLGAAPAPAPAAAAAPEPVKRGLFGLKRKKKQGNDSTVTPAPQAAAAPALPPVARTTALPDKPSGTWGFAPAAPALGGPQGLPPAPSAPGAFPVRDSLAPAPATPHRRSPSALSAPEFEPEGFTYSPPTFGTAISSGIEPAGATRPAPSASAFFGQREDEAPAPVAAPAPVLPVLPPVAEATSWGAGGGIDSELSARLALQAGIQEQALAELSQLSSYRPNQMAGDASNTNLTKRVRTEVPKSTVPEEGAAKISRDAAELRSRLSSFVSATNRARQQGDAEPGHDVHEQTPDPAPQSR